MAYASYIFILIWTAVAALLANVTNGKKTEIVCGEKVVRYKWIWAIILIIPIIYLTANRHLNIGDTGAYAQTFLVMPTEMSALPDYMQSITKDELYYFTAALIHIFITKSYIVYFGIIATFQIFVLVKVYRKYSEDFFISMFLFFASTDYISWMQNGIRQFVAVCITFLCFGLILKKKYIPAAIIIIFASYFHGSALILLPFMFIAQGKAWNKKTVFFLFAVMIAVASIDQFTDILDGLLEDTQYQNVVSDWTEWGDDGTNVLRVLVYSVPAVISLYGKKEIDKQNDPIVNLCTNMSIVSAGIYIISIFTSGIFIGRLPIYFSLYSYVLLPWEINHIFKHDSKRIVKLIMVVLYIAFYLYSIL